MKDVRLDPTKSTDMTVTKDDEVTLHVPNTRIARLVQLGLHKERAEKQRKDKRRRQRDSRRRNRPQK